jgi:putative serine protease PepD
MVQQWEQSPLPAHPVWWTPPPRPEAPRSLRWSMVATLMAAAVLAGAAGGVLANPTGTTSGSAATATVTVTPAGPARDIASVIAGVQPAVVRILAQSRTRQEAGTGLVLTADGMVLTNAHVVTGATVITSRQAGETRLLPTQLIKSDPTADLALLRI